MQSSRTQAVSHLVNGLVKADIKWMKFGCCTKNDSLHETVCHQLAGVLVPRGRSVRTSASESPPVRGKVHVHHYQPTVACLFELDNAKCMSDARAWASSSYSQTEKLFVFHPITGQQLKHLIHDNVKKTGRQLIWFRKVSSSDWHQCIESNYYYLILFIFRGESNCHTVSMKHEL